MHELVLVQRHQSYQYCTKMPPVAVLYICPLLLLVLFPLCPALPTVFLLVMSFFFPVGCTSVLSVMLTLP